MRVPRLIPVIAVTAAILLAPASSVHSQAPRISPIAATSLSRELPAPDLRMPRVDPLELSRYAGWGGTIGAALGAGYGFAFARGKTRPLEILADTLIGFTGGMAAGTVVYLAKLTLGR